MMTRKPRTTTAKARATPARKRDAANSVTYLLNDYPRTLFPLSTTRVIAETWGQQTLDYVYQQVLNPAETEHSFLAQARCYSSKQGFHLRRTVKLDPVADFLSTTSSTGIGCCFGKTSGPTAGLLGIGSKMASRSHRLRAILHSKPPSQTPG